MAGTPGLSITATIKYVPNPPGILAAGQLYGGIGVKLATESIEAEAVALAPVRTGAYRDSIVSIVEGTEGAVYSSIRYGGYIEFGTSDTPTFAVLRRASDGEKF